MKIRNDFVSNSSSCSFVINDSKLKYAIERFADLVYDYSVPYGLNIYVSLLVKNKDFAELETTYVGKTEFKEKYVTYDGLEHTLDPEDSDWICMSLHAFVNCIGKVIDTADKIMKVRFSCDDFEIESRGVIYSMYTFFDNADADPDASDTERDFMEETDIDTFKRILERK